MKVSVLINNYNYQNYVLEAIASALKQTIQPDEIIVVDDGSKDNSAQILRDHFVDHAKVKLILKEKNQGQLSCFNEGFLASSGDIVFFLDADDLYKENYIEETLEFYKKQPDCDFLFCDFERFGNIEGFRSDYRTDRDLGYSTISTLYRQRWLGSVTTAISARRKVLEKILPNPYLEDWIYCADSCLVYGASLVGAKKFYMAQPLVLYRLHGNNFHNTGKGRIDKQKFDRLASLLFDRIGFDKELKNKIDSEFKTIPRPFYKEFRLYLNILKRSDVPYIEKIKMGLSISLHFLMHGDFFSDVPKWHV